MVSWSRRWDVGAAAAFGCTVKVISVGGGGRVGGENQDGASKVDRLMITFAAAGGAGGVG